MTQKIESQQKGVKSTAPLANMPQPKMSGNAQAKRLSVEESIGRIASPQKITSGRKGVTHK